MKAIILAAGRATRLRPLTENIPKCLLNVGDEAIIDVQMRALNSAKISEVIVVTGFQSEKLKEYLLSKCGSFRIKFVKNEKFDETGAAYSLWCAREFLSGDVLYLNSDLLCDPEIIRMVASDPRDSVTAIQKTAWDEEEVNVRLDYNMSVLEIGKHIKESESVGEFIGATKFGPEFIPALKKELESLVAKGGLKRFAADAINGAVQAGQKLYALDVSDKIAVEIDTIEDFERAKNIWFSYDNN